MEYLFIIFSAIFVNNIVLAQFLGIYPFLEVSTHTKSALTMSAFLGLIMILATTVTWLIFHHMLLPLHLPYLQTLTFILTIIALVQFMEMILKKVRPALHRALGIYLPLATSNCAVLGVALLAIKNNLSLAESIVFTAATAIGYAMALIIFSAIRQQFVLTDIPKSMAGIPIALITAGILALAFMGFAGMR